MAEAIACMASEQATRNESTRLSEQAERDACSATARVLQRAGRMGKAHTLMTTAPPHRATPTHVGATLSLTPSEVTSCAPPPLASPREPVAES